MAGNITTGNNEQPRLDAGAVSVCRYSAGNATDKKGLNFMPFYKVSRTFHDDGDWHHPYDVKYVVYAKSPEHAIQLVDKEYKPHSLTTAGDTKAELLTRSFGVKFVSRK